MQGRKHKGVIMKVSVFWAVVLIVFAFILSVAFSTEDSTTVSLIPVGLVSQRQVTERTILKTRRLKDGGRSSSPKMDVEAGDVDLDDYRPIDPSPSSKTSIRPGPIQHGTPYMPYVPKLSPPPPSPGHPK